MFMLLLFWIKKLNPLKGVTKYRKQIGVEYDMIIG